MDFRRGAGLRSDQAWVRHLATLPEALEGVAAFSIPMTPEEVRTLLGRALTSDEVMEVVQKYAAKRPDVWAGAYVDPTRGSVVALFTEPVEGHESALRPMLRPDAPLDVFEALWPLRDLEELQMVITADLAWIRKRDTYFLGVGVDIPSNTVYLDVSSSRPGIERDLIEHFNAEGKLRVSSDGTGIRLFPTGSLRGSVTDTNGDPLDLSVEGYLIEIVGDIPGAGPIGPVGYGTGRPGQFLFEDIAAVGYEIQVFQERGMVLLGTDRAVVRAGKITDVTVVVDLE